MTYAIFYNSWLAGWTLTDGKVYDIMDYRSVSTIFYNVIAIFIYLGAFIMFFCITKCKKNKKLVQEI